MYSLYTAEGDNMQILKDEAFGNWNLSGHVNDKEELAKANEVYLTFKKK